MTKKTTKPTKDKIPPETTTEKPVKEPKPKKEQQKQPAPKKTTKPTKDKSPEMTEKTNEITVGNL